MAILTLSREYGSGGRNIGRTVAAEIGYDYVDRGRILEDMAREGEKWEEKAKKFDENYPDVWERNDWTFRGFVVLNQSHFLQYAEKGNVVIMGRGGSFLLGAFPMVLKVRIKAPFEKRVERIMGREGINDENARYLVKKVDEEMTKAVYLIYGKNIDDQDEYDLVFDTNEKSREDIVDAIKKALAEKDAFDTAPAREALRLRSLAERIKAAITINPDFHLSMLDVDPAEEGMAKYGFVVRGIVHERDDIEAIKKLSQKMAGDLPVETRLQYRMVSRFGR